MCIKGKLDDTFVTGFNAYIFSQENCIDSTVPAEAVFAQEVKKLQKEQFKPSE